MCSLENISSLVTTGEGNFYSTGLDLKLFESADSKMFLELLEEHQKLLARILALQLVTVAAING